jgi:GntR family transcriptional regulator of gluconate operon
VTENHPAASVDPYSLNQFEGERVLLRDQVIERLRSHIVNGHFSPGTKLVERKVAEWLGVSRIPARDALLQLEQEGLVETRSTGRHVIEFTEEDIRELYQVRGALERVAAELAAQNTCPDGRAALTDCLAAMREAVAHQDRSQYVAADVEMHWLIWRQAGNKYLLRLLGSMIGPIYMFVANNIDATNRDWEGTFALHESLAKSISSGNVAASIESLDLHMQSALRNSLQAYRASEANE